jgi:uncharacterized protein with ParB-like and HNH nuclease domain/predicted transport protein
MEAKPANMLKFIQRDTQFVIPLYQRTYSWTEKQCKQLWDDIVRAASNDNVPTHFLGSIVYIHEGVLQNSSVPQLVVIDGQQRLTTLSLLLVALRQHMQAGNPGTEITPKKINNYYLVNSEEEGELRHKLVLTQNDRDTLIRLVEGKTLPKAVAERVVENYTFFQERIVRSELMPDDLWRGISKLIVVDIALERGKDNPQLIFESLNSTGLDLSETDKIRNYVLMDLPPAEQKSIYQEYWYPMERGFDPNSPQQFDSFVRDYLTVKTRRIPNIYEIYPKFKSYVEQGRAAGVSTEEIVADLHKYSVYYVRMARLSEEDRQLRAAFADLNGFRMYVANPFLLEVYDDFEQGRLTRDEFVQIVRLVESYGFRRATCGIPTNSLNKTFQNLGREIDKSKYLESVNLAFLLKDSYTRFPTDVEFKEQFIRRDAYNSPRVKYLLRKLENYKRKEPVNVDEYTIEHIMPQNSNLNAEWQADLGPDWQNVQQTYLHTIGNLTLTGYNSTLSDRPFLEKREMPGGFHDSPIRLNHIPGQLDHWNETTILQRAQKLAETAAEIWPPVYVPPDVLAKHQTKRAYRVSAGVTIEEMVDRSPEKHREVFWKLREAILSLDSAITERPHWEPEVYPYNHVSYRLKSTFADVVIQDRWVRVCLNIKKEHLDDPAGRAEDVAGMGYWGGGETLVTLTREDQVNYVLALVEQAYELQRQTQGEGRDNYVALGEGEHRTWDDCVKYGFVSAGHGKWYSKPLELLSPGARVFVHVPGKGYTGVGIVQEGPVRVTGFRVQLGGSEVGILDAPLKAPKMGEDADNPDLSEYLVRVEWLRTLPVEEAIWEKGMFAN